MLRASLDVERAAREAARSAARRQLADRGVVRVPLRAPMNADPFLDAAYVNARRRAADVDEQARR